MVAKPNHVPFNLEFQIVSYPTMVWILISLPPRVSFWPKSASNLLIDKGMKSPQISFDSRLISARRMHRPAEFADRFDGISSRNSELFGGNVQRSGCQTIFLKSHRRSSKKPLHRL